MAVKKELEIYHPHGTALYAVRFVKGGELPEMLKTMYTSPAEAQKGINAYYASKAPKGKKEESVFAEA